MSQLQGLTIDEARVLRGALGVALDAGSYPEPEVEATAERLRAQLEGFIRAAATGTLLMWSDGAARPTNPGPAGIGVIARREGVEAPILEVAEYIGRTTNNVAEYLAAVTALRRAVDIGATNVILHCDSKLVVNQFKGAWQCRDQSLIPLLGRLRGLSQRFDTCEVRWIPREKNREADGLSVAGAYAPKACGMCTHDWHFSSFCTAPGDAPGETCGCPYGYRGGLEA